MAKTTISKFVAKENPHLRQISHDSAIEMSVLVKEATPVGKTGVAKKGWIADGSLLKDAKYTYLNNVEYIIPLEYGWSPQARNPDGMLRKNVRNWRDIVARNR